MNETWQALTREAAIAAEHMAIGATALSKANYAQHAYYGQAFFALTIGFERASKLAYVVDYALEHAGQFPPHKVVRGKRHNLSELLKDADEIAVRRGLLDNDYRLPRTAVHLGIIEVLTDFAENVTRYYNLDFVTGDPQSKNTMDPVRAWYEKVTMLVLTAHYTPRHMHENMQRASVVAEVLGGSARVSYHTETGAVLDSLYDASLLTGQTRFAIPYTRMYVLQIARFLGNLLSELGHAGYRLDSPIIPHLSEFFAIFFNGDDYFKRRKTWSIY